MAARADGVQIGGMTAPAATNFSLRSLAQRIAVVVQRVIGVPDYERYVRHVRERHPGTEPVSREEFIRERMASRYSKPGARCC
jgi:uncharacterized short protein YbdD (DUF466 family)